MTAEEIHLMGALELGRVIRKGEISPVEVARHFLATLPAVNGPLNAVVTVDEEAVIQAATRVEGRLRAGEELSPLAGVPFLAKDLDVTAGLRTTFGSLLFKDYVPGWDMTHIARLKAAGCVLLGKTNTPEDGTIPNTMNPVFGATRNPWNHGRSAGGSSGGSGAAVAAYLAPLATGSDGAGSIRIPASFNGIFGLKPTFGVVPFGPRGIGIVNTIGHLGPMTRSADDAAAMLDIMSGPDERDRSSLPKTQGYQASLDSQFAPRKIACSVDLGYASVDEEVRGLFELKIEELRNAGWPIVNAHPGFSDPMTAIQSFITFEWGTIPMLLEAENPAGYALQSEEVRALAERRSQLTLADLWEAHRVRKKLCVQLGEFFQEYDLLLTPTLTRTAFEYDRAWPRSRRDPALEDRAFNSMLYPFNLSGDPACSLPIGLDSAGLPVGLQIVGPRHRDALVLQAAGRIMSG